MNEGISKESASVSYVSFDRAVELGREHGWQNPILNLCFACWAAEWMKGFTLTPACPWDVLFPTTILKCLALSSNGWFGMEKGLDL